jgi:hypothetical protein
MSYKGKSRLQRLEVRNTSAKPDGNDKPLPAFGVCGNDAIHCRFSFENPNLKGLINRLGSGKHDAAILQPFKHFFQIDGACRGCNAPVIRDIQPTEGLSQESAAYKKLVRLNQVLEAGYRLQALGVLPHANL